MFFFPCRDLKLRDACSPTLSFLRKIQTLSTCGPKTRIRQSETLRSRPGSGHAYSRYMEFESGIHGSRTAERDPSTLAWTGEAPAETPLVLHRTVRMIPDFLFAAVLPQLQSDKFSPTCRGSIQRFYLPAVKKIVPRPFVRSTYFCFFPTTSGLIQIVGALWTPWTRT